ncbi:GumC family protein [Nitrococcus mobilis]|uniref:Exopolysaccharide biosynthesis protein n=1 Tax=Nitrococcus mobilis Nb-231 TaxID=314278 RepID=A4BNE8_9GAMM|nr:polysaccharide biosynthesis tyrosine autokinase [Nitrococcus mobilis]EAR22747.1 exopolysaccharide biosynthesis protein [Nitrococcus mobilis Nb-231]
MNRKRSSHLLELRTGPQSAAYSPVEPHWTETAQPGQETGLLEYLRVLVRHRLLIIGVVTMALLAALSYGLLQTPLYQGVMTLHMRANPPVYVHALQDLQTPTDTKMFYVTQMDIIRSRAVAERVAERLTPEQRKQLRSPPAVTNYLASLVNTLWNQVRDWLGLDESDQTALAADPQRASRALVKQIQNNLSVIRRKDSELVEIQYYAPTPELAARIANLLGESYRATQIDQRLTVSKEVHAWLSEQLNKLGANLSRAERSLQQYKEQQQLLDSKNLEQIKSTQLSGLTQNLLEARAERMRAEVLYQQVQDADSVAALSAVLNNPGIQPLKMQQGTLRAKLENLRTHYGENAPKIQAIRAELESTSARLHQEIDRAVTSIREQYEEAKQRERQLEKAEQELGEGVRSRSAEALQLATLEREVETNRELFEAFRDRIKEISLADTMGASGIQILDRSLPPNAPFSPNFSRLLGIAGVLSLFLGIGLAFLLENLRRTFHTSQAAGQRLQLRDLGVMPRVRLQRPATLSRLAVLEPESAFTEALGSIRARLQVSDPSGTGPQLVIVTSAVQGEGKSTLSNNLASSYSQLGPTLLVDADLRHPSLSSGWKRAGLTEFVLGKAPLGGCIYRDNISPNLFVIGKGDTLVNPLEFFATADLAGAFTELRRHFNKIIVDTAPVLSVSDVETLGMYTDGAILAVKAGKTPSEAVAEAYRRLQEAHVRVLGIILTQANMGEVARYGGYVYGPY